LEQDWDDVVSTLRRTGGLRGNNLTLGEPVRLRSLESDNSQGLASAFYAQRPKSFDVTQADDDHDDFLPETEKDKSSENEGGFRPRTLERKNAVDELTPVNSWRRRQGPGAAGVDRGETEPLRERTRQSPAVGRRGELPSPTATNSGFVDPMLKMGKIQSSLHISKPGLLPMKFFNR